MRARTWSLLVAVAGLGACREARAPAAGGVPAAVTTETTKAVGEGAELIGKPMPEWEVSDWIGSPPLTLASLRGKVVLVRWFTASDCPYCAATAPALNQLHRDFADRGLVVLGFYHHKRAEPLEVRAVQSWVQGYGFHFPVAIDRDWKTLRRWWLAGRARDFTSVSFLIDRAGLVRHIHPGGTLAPGTPDFATMRGHIERALQP